MSASDDPANGANRQVLLRALDRLEDTEVEFAGFLANHGPMAVDAAIRLGAGSLVDDWLDRYLPTLERRGNASARPLEENRWQDQLGAYNLVGAWRQYFERHIDRHGWNATLVIWWPRLLPGAAASATHGIIRTAHATRNLVEYGDDHRLLRGELAAGLALWAARFQHLPRSTTGRRLRSLDDAIAALPRLPPDTPSRGEGIGGRLAALDTVPGLLDALGAWNRPADPTTALDELIAAAARMVIERGDAPIPFCHALTAPAAVRIVMPCLPATYHEASVITCWSILAAIVAAFPGPAQGHHPPRGRPPARDQVARRAAAHGDEHVMKVAEACLREHRRSGDPMLLIAADTIRSRFRPFW